MATASSKTIFPHITTDPWVCHGRPCIAGTRVGVMDIVAAHDQGIAPAKLQDYFATRPLTLAENLRGLGVLQRPQGRGRGRIRRGYAIDGRRRRERDRMFQPASGRIVAVGFRPHRRALA